MIYRSRTTNHVARNKGQALIIAVVFFTLISSAVAAGIAVPLVKNFRIAAETRNSKESFFLAEALTEDILYRYKNGMDVDSSETLTINGNIASAVVTNTPFGRNVVATSDVGNAVRRIETELIAGVGASFNFGVQVGTGGFIIDNSATVDGNVYSNGNITGQNGARVTGSAFAANSIALVSDQSNTTPSTPPNTVSFGNANGTQDIAQSFQLSADGRVNKVQLYIRKTGNPASATVRVVADDGGNPDDVTIASGVLTAAQVTGSFGWAEVVFTSNPELFTDETYWIVVDNGSSNASNYYLLAANNTYSGGQAKIGRHTVSWGATSPAGLDGYFSLFLGGLTSTINNVDVGTDGIGNAHAHTVTNSDIEGNLYCITGSGNNKVCNTTQTDPAPQPFPISDANIAQWKEEADDGTTIAGDYLVTGSSVSLGPAKITGNLNVNTNATLTLTGTLWVEGDVILDNNVIIKLSPGYGSNSGVLVTDGRIELSNNAVFQGSGQSGTYILLVTTSECPQGSGCDGDYAISLGNNAGTVALNAQRGTLFFANNAGAKQATAHTIVLDNNATIVYETGLANLNFVSGPGGAFNITGWREIE